MNREFIITCIADNFSKPHVAADMLIQLTQNKSAKENINELEMADQTYYRYLKKFKQLGIVDKNNQVTLKRIRNYPMPSIMREGILKKGHEYVHLATYLSKFKDEDTVPPYNLPKKLIIHMFRDYMDKHTVELEIWMEQAYDFLGMMAIFFDKFDAFEGMEGNLNPPSQLPWIKP